MENLTDYGSQKEEIEFLRMLIQRVPANLFVFNLLTGVSEFNSDGVIELAGYTNEDVLKMGDQVLQKLIHPDDLPVTMEDLENAAKIEGDEFTTPVEFRIKSKMDEWIWVASTMRVLDRTEDGRVKRIAGAAHSIDRQKEAELGLRDTNELLNVIVKVIPSGVIGINDSGQVISINDPARNLIGDLSTELPFNMPINKRVLDINLNSLPNGRTPIERTLKGEKIDSELFCFVSPTGETHYLKISNAKNTFGTSSLKAVIVIDDVTDQEKQRQTIERADRLDALGQLAGGIAHDFNNLLATVQYALRLTKNDPCSEKQTKYLDTALNSVKNGADLTKRLLAFAKHQPGLEKSRPVFEAIFDIQKLAAPLIEANITLDVQDIDRDLWVYCDPVQLDSALMNLLLNARDAILNSGHGNRITLFARSVTEVDTDATLRREHKNSYIAQGQHDEHQQDQLREDNAAYRYVEFGVTDNGPGMPEEVKSRAVDPFYTTKEHNAGTGLGLSTVYGFVQQAGGELRIYSEVGQGTTVRVLLPRGTPDGVREGPVEAVEKAIGDGESILLVEDDADLLLMMDDLVSSLGYKTTCARSGGEALELVSGEQVYDLMITDIVMPGGMDGFELAKRMIKLRPEIGLLYTSGYTGYSEEDMQGIVAPLLQKPCEPVELADAIDGALKIRSSTI